MGINSDITAVVLAGGMARRMGGGDKGLIQFRGQPLISHVLQRVESQVGLILINANRNHSDYHALGFEVLSDPQAGYQGPMMGFLSGLQALSSEWLLVVPCDSPFVPMDLASRLLHAARQQSARIAVARDGKRIQPVFALIHRSLQEDLECCLADGERKIDRWYARHVMAEVDFSDQPAAFINLNTPDELAQMDKGTEA